MKQSEVPVPQYPWPTLTSPFAESDFPEEKEWYDSEYTFLSKETREKYKGHILAKCSAWMVPALSDRKSLLMVSRYLNYHTVFDDYFELCPVDKAKAYRDHLVEIVLGKQPNPDDIGLFHQAAKSMSEVRDTGMPAFWFERIAQEFYDYTTYGLIEETPYKLAGGKIFPPLQHVLSLREYAIGMGPYFCMIEPAFRISVPVDIFRHPMIQNIRRNIYRAFGLQNDLVSLERELSRGIEVINAILVLRHYNKISLEESCAEVLRMHDAYVAEVVAIEANLPEFGIHNDVAHQYIFHMKQMLSGLGNWYQKSGTIRYIPSGYPEPEYGK
jgi:hypothetical protein